MSKNLREEYITDNVRVMLDEVEAGVYYVYAQERAHPNWMPWEVSADGWRTSVASWQRVLPAANEVFDEIAARERRFAS